MAEGMGIDPKDLECRLTDDGGALVSMKDNANDIVVAAPELHKSPVDFVMNIDAVVGPAVVVPGNAAGLQPQIHDGTLTSGFVAEKDRGQCHVRLKDGSQINGIHMKP